MRKRGIAMKDIMIWVLAIAVCGSIAFTVTACRQQQEDIAKNTPNGIEETVENTEEQDEIDKLLAESEALGKQIESEAKSMWDTHQEQLKQYIENGLTYDNFKDVYVYSTDYEDMDASERYEQAFDLVAKYYNAEYLAAAKEDHSMFNFEGNVTDNGDGTYTFSDAFINACRDKIPYFAGATDDEIKDFVEAYAELEMFNGDDIWQILYTQEGNLHAENLYIEGYGNTEETDRLEAAARANSEQTEAPAETQPAETKPASKPAQTQPAETKPVQPDTSVSQEQASTNPEVDKTPSQPAENSDSGYINPAFGDADVSAFDPNGGYHTDEHITVH